MHSPYLSPTTAFLINYSCVFIILSLVWLVLPYKIHILTKISVNYVFLLLLLPTLPRNLHHSSWNVVWLLVFRLWAFLARFYISFFYFFPRPVPLLSYHVEVLLLIYFPFSFNCLESTLKQIVKKKFHGFKLFYLRT